MKAAGVLQAAGVVLLTVPVAVVFGWWALMSFAGLMTLAVGVALERRAVDGP